MIGKGKIKKMLITLGMVSITFSSPLVNFSIENNSPPQTWQNGFLIGYKIGYQYCLVDKQVLNQITKELEEINFLEKLLKRYGGVKDKGNYYEVTLKIPKNAPSLVRLAKYVRQIEANKNQLGGWIVYLNGINYPEVKLGWYIEIARQEGFSPLKIGKVIIFDSEPTKTDAEYVKNKLEQKGIPSLKILKVD